MKSKFFRIIIVGKLFLCYTQCIEGTYVCISGAFNRVEEYGSPIRAVEMKNVFQGCLES